MTMIVHRCGICGKPDYWRDGKIAASRTVNGEPPESGDSRTCCRTKTWGDPETVPTFDGNGHRIATVMRPGGSAGAKGSTTCACDDCRAFYNGLVKA